MPNFKTNALINCLIASGASKNKVQMNNNKLTEQEINIQSLLTEAFHKHGVECKEENNQIVFPQQFMTCRVHLFDKSSSASIVQMDVNFEFGLGKIITESTVGIGLTLDIAIEDAFQAFLKSSFHVILSAFFTHDYDNHVNLKEWFIGNKKYTAIISNVSVRGEAPDPLPVKWLDQLENLFQNQEYLPGTHWIKLYYAQSEREMISSEILLDNKVWTEVEKTVRNFDFPSARDFLAVRIFIILQDDTDVSQMAATMAWMSGEDEEDVLQELTKTGTSPLDAEKALIFIPLAFGRVFLKSIASSHFSDEAVITDETEKQTTINLNDEPIYVAAYQLAKYIMTEGLNNKEDFQTIVALSSEVNAYNNALMDGAKPEDMDGGHFGSPMIFLPHYQPAEKEKNKIINKPPQQQQAEKKKKPFWKFWSKE